ncbi:MAG: hypothetical protein LC637_01120 [Xanthomonadaceae bacterium]|nr:hypothetical protein [Xanthomonadaceae bacterium]
MNNKNSQKSPISEIISQVSAFNIEQKKLDTRLNQELDLMDKLIARGDIKNANKKVKTITSLLNWYADRQRSALLPFLKVLLNSGEKAKSSVALSDSPAQPLRLDEDRCARLKQAISNLRSVIIGQLSALEPLSESNQKPMRKSAKHLMKSGLEVDGELKRIIEALSQVEVRS